MNTPPLSLEQGKSSVFYWDAWRGNWLVLTPEEWVRQHVLFALLEMGFPPACISVEKSAGLKSKGRYDVLAFGPDGLPRILVECKEPGERLKIPVALQAMGYQEDLFSPFVWLSNGLRHVFLTRNRTSGNLEQLANLPSYAEIIAVVP